MFRIPTHPQHNPHLRPQVTRHHNQGTTTKGANYEVAHRPANLLMLAKSSARRSLFVRRGTKMPWSSGDGNDKDEGEEGGEHQLDDVSKA